jgi:protein-S-isoprenylcysteine O-methyltransferase Ste14
MSIQDASRLATSVLVATVLALFFRHELLAEQPVPIALQVVAAVLMLAARLTFGLRSFHAAARPTEGGLVTTGPYRLVRHPIYSSILLFVWAGVWSHLSAVSVALGAGATLATGVRIVAEERLVLERYPEYAAYAARTKRVIPFLL